MGDEFTGVDGGVRRESVAFRGTSATGAGGERGAEGAGAVVHELRSGGGERVRTAQRAPWNTAHVGAEGRVDCELRRTRSATARGRRLLFGMWERSATPRWSRVPRYVYSE